MRRLTFYFLIILNSSFVFGQNYIFHGNNRLILNQQISEYKVGDTLKSYDSLKNMSLIGIFSSVKFAINLSLHYSDSSGKRTIDVTAVLRDSNLLWHGKSVEVDRSSKHSIVRYFTMDKFEGVSTYYIRDQVLNVSSIKLGNLTEIGIDSKTGKMSYYWTFDTLKREDGSDLSFHENGEVKSFGHYEKGIRVGEWFYYDDKGCLLLIEYYKNGTLVRSKKKRKK